MGKLLSYSGISTKIRAMQSKLITEDQIQEMLQFTSTSHAAAWLKRTPEYSKTWASLDENSLHRGQIEKLLKASIFDDFSKIYQFASSEQRKFLDLYSRRYEIRVLKELMTCLTTAIQTLSTFLLTGSSSVGIPTSIWMHLQHAKRWTNSSMPLKETNFTVHSLRYRTTIPHSFLITEWLWIYIIFH